MNAEQIIEELALLPHPEGGHYRETFRDEGKVGDRSHSTAIYFLLQRGEVSRWHRVDSAEIFHYYAGAPLEISTLENTDNGETEVTRILGPNVLEGQQPQVLIQPGQWQSARSLGDFTLVGCTVSPGFEFEFFEMKPDQ